MVALGNQLGIALQGTGHVVTSSVVNANAGAGIDVAGTGSSATVTKTNVFGNGSDSPVNCGLVLSGTGNTATATGNYWDPVRHFGAEDADQAPPLSG